MVIDMAFGRVTKQLVEGGMLDVIRTFGVSVNLLDDLGAGVFKYEFLGDIVPETDGEIEVWFFRDDTRLTIAFKEIKNIQHS